MLNPAGSRETCICGCGSRTRRRDSEGRPDCRQQRKPSGKSWKNKAAKLAALEQIRPSGGVDAAPRQVVQRIRGKKRVPREGWAQRAAPPLPRPGLPMAQVSLPGPAAPLANSGEASVAALAPAGAGGDALAPAGEMATPGGCEVSAPRGAPPHPLRSSLPKNMRELDEWLDGVRAGCLDALGSKQWGFCWHAHVMSFVEKDRFGAAFAAAVAAGELACSAFCFNVVALGAKLMGGSLGEADVAEAGRHRPAASPYEVLTELLQLRSEDPEWVRLSRRADWALTCIFLDLGGGPANIWVA